MIDINEYTRLLIILGHAREKYGEGSSEADNVTNELVAMYDDLPSHLAVSLDHPSNLPYDTQDEVLEYV